jgi:hypothetical protein
VSGAGSIVVRVSESGGDLVAAATADKTIEVRKASNTIEFSDIGYQTVGDGVSLSAIASSGLSVSFQVVENSLVPNVAPEFTSITSDVLTATQAGIVLDIIDDQRTCMEAFDRIADSQGHRSNPTGHLITQLQQGSSDPLPLSAFKIAHWPMERTVEKFSQVGGHPGTLSDWVDGCVGIG